MYDTSECKRWGKWIDTSEIYKHSFILAKKGNKWENSFNFRGNKWGKRLPAIWREDQCDILHEIGDKNVEKCKKACIKNRKCNAIIIEGDEKSKCRLLRCKYSNSDQAVLRPTIVYGFPGKNMATSMCVGRQVSEQCLSQWKDSCLFT